jgi:hypothetical protein
MGARASTVNRPAGAPLGFVSQGKLNTHYREAGCQLQNGTQKNASYFVQNSKFVAKRNELLIALLIILRVFTITYFSAVSSILPNIFK